MSKQKSITIITANFFPEDTAIGLYTYQMCNYLIEKGYEINVITAFPYYPKWEIWNEYKLKPSFFEETINKIKVYRYKQFVPQKVSFKGRVFLMLSLLYGTILNSRKIKSTDLVICIVPFTFSILAGVFLTRKTKSKLWVHVQDFEFDLAFDSGVLKKKNIVLNLIKKTLFKFESYLLNKATVLSSISNGMLKKVVKKSSCKNLFYFPNWVSSLNINPKTSKQHHYIAKDKFTLLYSGNIGEKQDWILFEKLCAIIKDETVEIVIVGDGSYLNTLKEKVSKFSFVKFYELVPFEELSNLLCSADIHFLFQKNDVIDSVMPSKILGMMASERPSIITGNSKSEVASIFNNNCGFYFSNNDEFKIYSKIMQLKENRELSYNIGVNARNYILKNFLEEEILGKFEQKIRYELI